MWHIEEYGRAAAVRTAALRDMAGPQFRADYYYHVKTVVMTKATRDYLRAIL